MTAATDLLARLNARGIAATIASDGRILLSGSQVPEKAQRLAERHTGPLRGLLAHQAFLDDGEPSAWCNHCGTTVTQYSPDGTAWCDPCLTAHATRLITTQFDSAQVVEEVTTHPNKDTGTQLTLTQEKD